MLSDFNMYIAFIIDWINVSGFIGILAFILLFIFLTVVLFVPAWFMAAISGYVFGTLYGSLIVSIAGIVGASIAFFIARYVARAKVNEKLSSNDYYHALVESISEKGTWGIFWLRLSSIIPFAPLSYMIGLTNIKAKNYIMASWVGMLPGTILYVYLGSLAKSINDISNTNHSSNKMILIIGVFAAWIAVFLFSINARKKLKDIRSK